MLRLRALRDGAGVGVSGGGCGTARRLASLPDSAGRFRTKGRPGRCRAGLWFPRIGDASVRAVGGTVGTEPGALPSPPGNRLGSRRDFLSARGDPALARAASRGSTARKALLMDDATLQAAADRLTWFHSIELRPAVVTKGGSWFDGPEDCRAAARRRRLENELDLNLGFRVLREL